MTSAPPLTRQLFVDGEYCDADRGEFFDKRDPATGERVARVALADADDVDRAVQAARRGQRAWARLPLEQRVRVLQRVADRIDARRQDFLAAEVADTGKPASLASRLDIPRGAANFRAFASVGASVSGASWLGDTPDGGAGSMLNYTVRAPLGVVGVICPWNLPLLLMTWKVAPALAAGNAVVVKPSEETPSTATLLGEVMNEAGVPAGVYNVVHGFGPGSTGEALVGHPQVAGITFTGESTTGATIMRQAAPQMKRVSFELGGKNAAIVFADADFEEAVAGVARSTFTNCGQVCLCSERVYVERPIFERFVQALADRARAERAGDPWASETSLGPLISAGHREKVLSYYGLARQEGAEVVVGGGIPSLDDRLQGGYFIEPTVWIGLDEGARCIREEIFGPVCHVRPFDTEEEAIALANDSDYGLCAALWTRDVKRAHRVAHQIDVGLVWVNTWFLRDLRSPFGGTRRSGLGREGGLYSMDFYSETRNICLKL